MNAARASLLLSLLMAWALALPAIGQTHLQVVDIVEIRQTGSSSRTEFSRQIGLGVDSPKKSSFDAAVTDLLPAGIKLLSPSPGKTQITGLDAHKHPVSLVVKKTSKATEMRMGFENIPTLPQHSQCCDCSNDCDRACSIQYTYRTTAHSGSSGLGSLACSVSPSRIPTGKLSRVRITMKADATALKDAILEVDVPESSKGTTIKLHKAPPSLCPTSRFRRIGLSSRPGVRRQSFVVELDVRPARKGRVDLIDCVRLEGLMSKPVRPMPRLDGGVKYTCDHSTYSALKYSLGLIAD